MNVQEFTERTGYTPASDAEWNEIEMMYLQSGESVDKDLFCQDWLKHKDSRLLRAFYKLALDRSKKIDYYKWQFTKTAMLIIDRGDDIDDSMYRQAVKIIGQKQVVLYKIEQGYELNQDEKDYIQNNLQ